jgi:hypothetical protein
MTASTIARKCIICGCSQLQACQTDSGPCHWVAANLCSGCVGAVCMVNQPGIIVFPNGDFMEDAVKVSYGGAAG